MKEYKYSSSSGDQMRIRIYILLILLASYGTTEGFIGINWGRQSAQRLLPSQVVDLLLQNGIRHAKIYSSQQDILEAFVNSGIELTLTLHDSSMFSPLNAARKWVQQKQMYFESCTIRTITLGFIYADGPLMSNALMKGKKLEQLMNLQTALKEMGYNKIKANFVNYAIMLKRNITKPSEAEFRDDFKAEMAQFAQFLRDNNSPLLIDMVPILDALNLKFDMNFAFMDNRSKIVVKDVNGAVYTNMFTFTYDCFVWALKKINASDLRVVVTQVGWATDGHPGCSAAAAECFFKHLLPLVTSNTGTPMRPGAPIDIFVHALTDEPKMAHSDPLARHWGIYRSNGQPKYKIDLSGRGRSVYPVVMKGIDRMPKRWCVFNGERSDVGLVREQLNFTCTKADCSSLAKGGSCSTLNFEQRVSYAFNMYFQTQFQDEKACHLGGLSQVSVEDPSTGDCVFPVEVVRGQQLNYAPAVAKP